MDDMNTRAEVPLGTGVPARPSAWPRWFVGCGVALVLLVVATSLVVISHQRFLRELDMMGRCDFHLSCLGSAMTSYAEHNGGRLPDAGRWKQHLLPYLEEMWRHRKQSLQIDECFYRKGQYSKESIEQIRRAASQTVEDNFHCPAARDPRRSYAFNARLSGRLLSSFSGPKPVVVLFESDQTETAPGNAQLLPRRPRHDGQMDHYLVLHEGRLEPWAETARDSTAGIVWDAPSQGRPPVAGGG